VTDIAWDESTKMNISVATPAPRDGSSALVIGGRGMSDTHPHSRINITTSQNRRLFTNSAKDHREQRKR